MRITPAGISALVIDDDAESARVVREALEAAGVRVMTASSAEEARSLLGTVTPDIIIAELGLPGENGLALVQWLRSRTADPDIPAIGLLSSYGHYTREEAEAAGFNMCFRKPINPTEVLVAVALLARW